MNVTFVFPLRSEIRLEAGDWCCLSFEREGNRVDIQKPFPRTQFDWHWDSLTMHSKTSPPKEWFEFEAGQDEFETSLIRIQVTLPSDVTEEGLRKLTLETGLAVLQELTSWIRVLTGQFWIGYRGRDFNTQKYLVYVGEGKVDKPHHTGGAGWGFEYGRDLDAKTWAEIGTKLACAERPRPSRLFFCDALLDIVEGDIEQAIVALGVSCEIEVSTLRQDIVGKRDKEFQRLIEEYVRLRFDETFKLLEEFGCAPFSDFDNEANGLVQKLYRARGKAVHRGEGYFVENKIKVFITRTDIQKYVKAVESLFSWADAQRSLICAGRG